MFKNGLCDTWNFLQEDGWRKINQQNLCDFETEREIASMVLHNEQSSLYLLGGRDGTLWKGSLKGLHYSSI